MIRSLLLATLAIQGSTSIQGSPTPAPQDPNLLPIGRKGHCTVTPGQIYDLRSQRIATLDELVKAAEGKQFVFLGEQHATTAHQAFEADVVRALHMAGRDVSVGMEMFTRPRQDVLDQWPKGLMTESEFIDKSDWKHEWGYDYAFYRPVFEAVREFGLPLVALNVPRPWVHSVAMQGVLGLPVSARLQLPTDLYLGNLNHRQIFDAMMGGHPAGGPSTGEPSMENMYAAQVLWDEGMADTALKFTALKESLAKESRKEPKPGQSLFVVICGSGHVMYGQGINYRIARRRKASELTVVMLQSAEPVEVSRGLADFVYVTKP